MGIDTTSDFIEYTRALRKQRGLETKTEDIMKPIKSEVSPFTNQCVEVLRNVQAIEQFIADQYQSYVNISRFMSSKASKMTEGERDEIDAEATLFVKSCGNRIEGLREELMAGGASLESGTMHAHHHGAITYLFERLHTVAGRVSDMRNERLRQILATRQRVQATQPVSKAGPPVVMAPTTPYDEEDDFDLVPDDDGAGMNAEMEKVLEQENHALLRQVENELDDVRKMESRMMEISSLLATFTDKVGEQHSQVESLYETAVDSGEHLKKGNEQLDQAAEHNTQFRNYMLAFLIGASLILLVLDHLVA